MFVSALELLAADRQHRQDSQSVESQHQPDNRDTETENNSSFIRGPATKLPVVVSN